MKPLNLASHIFLDSGNPLETKEALEKMGFLDGQTTNPSLIAKNPEFQGKTFTKDELYRLYRETAQNIASSIPNGSISLEVYVDKESKYESLVEEAIMLNQWIPNAHIKLPITYVGLQVARTLVDKGVNVNMTLCFSQEQAAAVYQATTGAKPGQVFVSPFIGRLDDIGISGISLVYNIDRMYREEGDGHVKVLAASLRSIEHLMLCISRRIHIITAGIHIYREWVSMGLTVQDVNYQHISENETLVFQKGILNKSNLNIQHELTDTGLQKFADDWNNLIIN